MISRGLVVALLLVSVASACVAEAAPPAPLVFDRAELVARARRGGLRDASIEEGEGCAAIRGRVRHLGLLWPVRMEALFVREGGRVRMKAFRLLVSGRVMGARLPDANARLERLVDVESAAARVEIRDGGRLVYGQEVD